MNSDNKKVRYKMDCYILHLILVVIILLFIIAFICYHYEKYRSKQRHIGAPTVKKFPWKIVLNLILKNNLIYNISCKTLIGAKPLRIRFDKEGELTISFDRTRYLLLFGPEKYDVIYNRIRYLISQKNGITYVFFLIFMQKIKIDLFESLSLEKTLSLQNVIIILFKSVRNKKMKITTTLTYYLKNVPID